jgi:hypothetical protein
MGRFLINNADELWQLIRDCISKLRDSGRADIAERLDTAMRISNVGTEVYLETYSVLKEFRDVVAISCGRGKVEEAMSYIKSNVRDFKWND